jgi:hypothetical protein
MPTPRAGGRGQRALKKEIERLRMGKRESKRIVVKLNEALGFEADFYANGGAGEGC